MIERRKARQIQVGTLKIGGDTPVSIQSMTKTDTRDVQATVDQIWALEVAGCDIVRLGVPIREAAEKLGEIKKQIRIPLIADIHFNYKLALIALEQGVDGLRLNPGNIGDRSRVEQIVKLAAERKIPIRIGVNAGSLERDILARDGGPSPEGMVESALRHIRILEDLNYQEMKVSLKASDPLMMIEAYRMLADHLPLFEDQADPLAPCNADIGASGLPWPVHLTPHDGDMDLLFDPLRKGGLTFVACPSCARADIDLISLAQEVERRMAGIKKEIHVAVMGCEVNGPGEARGADIGVAGGKGIGLIFKKGEVIRKVKESEIADALMEEVNKMVAEGDAQA
ncbi:MAG: ispG, partial [candidate division NC10 bacterium]|nr:ispG [candidate division NC10 bacterium]